VCNVAVMPERRYSEPVFKIKVAGHPPSRSMSESGQPRSMTESRHCVTADMIEQAVAERTTTNRLNKLEGHTEIPDQISEHLYLGDRYAAYNKHWLQANNVSHIVNMAAVTCQCYFPGVFKYLSISILDTVSQDISQFFSACTKYINKAIASGGRVLVHCEAGRSRSATIVLQYMVTEYNMTLKAAYKRVKRARPIIMPNITFFSQLRKFERQCRGIESMALDVPYYILYNTELERRGVRERRRSRWVHYFKELLN